MPHSSGTKYRAWGKKEIVRKSAWGRVQRPLAKVVTGGKRIDPHRKGPPIKQEGLSLMEERDPSRFDEK